MDGPSTEETAVEILRELGLKVYEARCFVTLTRLSKGTASDISHRSEVPRARVYDAIRVLESMGLVDVQHSDPQQFRAVSIGEAIDLLEGEFTELTETLEETLSELESLDSGEQASAVNEVWALSGSSSIGRRTVELLLEADREIVIVLGTDAVFTEQLRSELQSAIDQGVSVIVGTISEPLHERVAEALPEAAVFVSELDWLTHSSIPDDTTEITRLLLVDKETILVSSYTGGDDSTHRNGEMAVFGHGFDNGIVAIARRLMATGLARDQAS